MLTPEPADLALINNVLGVSVQFDITSQNDPSPQRRRAIDFDAIDRALAVAEKWYAAGNDQVVAGTQGQSARGILAHVRHVAAQAEPHRPKARRA